MTEQQIYVAAVKIVRAMQAEVDDMDLDERIELAGEMAQITPPSATFSSFCALFEELFEDFDEDAFLEETRKK
jgi:hypothetical protein